MRRIEQEGERMGELVEEVHRLARLDQGQPLERQPVGAVKSPREANAARRALR